MSRIWAYCGMFLAGCAISLLPSQNLESKSGLSAAVLFAPTGNQMKIHAALQGELKNARRSIDVAIFNFTSKRIANVLKGQAKKVRVRVLADYKSAKEIKISVYKDLEKAGIQVKYVKLEGSGIRAHKFHHKFCVIDGVEVCTGSYNWTVAADTSNYENLLVIRDKKLAKQYAAEFERIWNKKEILKDSY